MNHLTCQKPLLLEPTRFKKPFFFKNEILLFTAISLIPKSFDNSFIVVFGLFRNSCSIIFRLLLSLIFLSALLQASDSLVLILLNGIFTTIEPEDSTRRP